MKFTREQLEEIALTENEYQLIVDRLDREPNHVELGMFGALWSEHCGYKHSKPLLKNFPSEGPHVLVKPGEENAGVVDIGDGLAVVFKIESHNHPSAIEPFQGAATGVGGIIRDILAMGARPIALLNALRFGHLDKPENKHLMKGVVEGISWYGNCIGIPNVGGEIAFSSSYDHNPLVNAMCVGLVEKKNLLSASIGTDGNVLLLVGADTGRDGIHGASGLASRSFVEDREMRPTVQVGNPFLEKLLVESCLEAAKSGTIEGLQDLGAAGLTSAAIEAARNSGGGIDIDLSRIHQRENAMTPYDIMLSESQERMLIAVKKGCEDRINAIFDRWEVPCVAIGTVTNKNTARITYGPTLVTEISIEALTTPPTYRLKGNISPKVVELRNYPLNQLPLHKDGPSKTLVNLLSSPNIASKQSVYRQYDTQVQTNTVVGPGSDAAIIRLRNSGKGIALCTDGNSRYCYLDPYQGGAIAVSEACRNLSCVGANPLAITDCLNFGNPEKPEIYYEMEECVKGMTDACQSLGIPVVSGNVSLYNETQGNDIYPTPVVGALGLLEDFSQHVTAGFVRDDDAVILIGQSKISGESSSLGGSEFLEITFGVVGGHPKIDLELEAKVQKLCRAGIIDGIISSAHDCSDGGLAVALAECCIANSHGFVSTCDINGRWDAALFGEAQSRIVISLKHSLLEKFSQLAITLDVPICRLGTVGGSSLTFKNLIDLPLNKLEHSWASGLSHHSNDQ